MPVERQQLNSGASEENRTPDKQLKRLLLYQLSYRSIFSANVFGLPIMRFFFLTLYIHCTTKIKICQVENFQIIMYYIYILSTIKRITRDNFFQCRPSKSKVFRDGCLRLMQFFSNFILRITITMHRKRGVDIWG